MQDGARQTDRRAVTGYRTLAETERYTRAADRKMLARQAIEKQGRERRTGKPLREVCRHP